MSEGSFGDGGSVDRRVTVRNDETHQEWLKADISAGILEVMSGRKSIDEVAERLAKRQAEADSNAIRDPLTGAFNKGYIGASLQREIAAAEKHGENLNLVFLDIDNFKKINDTYGHPAGDRVLVELTKIMTGKAGQTGIVGRWGGEELVMVVPGLSEDQVSTMVNDLGMNVMNDLGRSAGLENEAITVSVGVVSAKKGEKSSEVIKRADDQMYRAKEAGKNRMMTETPEGTEKEKTFAVD